MSKNNPPSAKAIKTKRILNIYHLFLICEEVSDVEIHNWLNFCLFYVEKKYDDWNKKTISRDIATLKNAGVPIRYSGKRKAYILSGKSESNITGEEKNNKAIAKLGKKELQYINKIKRLTSFMKRLREIRDSEPCDVHYTKMFPEVSKRTMQRDFAILDNIHYEINYKRTWDTPEDERFWEEPPLNHYYLNCDLLPDPWN